jgi:prevent-host-death family protein
MEKFGSRCITGTSSTSAGWIAHRRPQLSQPSCKHGFLTEACGAGLVKRTTRTQSSACASPTCTQFGIAPTALRSVGLAQAKAQLTALLDAVESGDEVEITRRVEPSVVMLSLEDYKAMEETSYLLRSTTWRRATDLFR